MNYMVFKDVRGLNVSRAAFVKIFGSSWFIGKWNKEVSSDE